jgi:hypothetical protein
MGSVSHIPNQKKTVRVDHVHDGDIYPILLPDGQYSVTLQRWNVEMKFGRPTLILVFRIEDSGEYYHRELLRYYEVETVRAYKRKGRTNLIRFKSSWRREWAKQIVRLFGKQKKNTDDFLDPDRLANRVLIVSTRTKKKDSNGSIPKEEWESKVDQILEISA